VPVDGFRDGVRRLTGGVGVHVIVDPVGGDRFTDSLRSLAREGRLLVLGFTGGEIPIVKVNRLLLTNTSVLGVASAEFWSDEPDYPGRQWRDLVPLIESGAIDPPIGPLFPLEDAAAAIRELDERRAAGRVLIRTR
jgi:NADPH2:quinone reductase